MWNKWEFNNKATSTKQDFLYIHSSGSWSVFQSLFMRRSMCYVHDPHATSSDNTGWISDRQDTRKQRVITSYLTGLRIALVSNPCSLCSSNSNQPWPPTKINPDLDFSVYLVIVNLLKRLWCVLSVSILGCVFHFVKWFTDSTTFCTLLHLASTRIMRHAHGSPKLRILFN